MSRQGQYERDRNYNRSIRQHNSGTFSSRKYTSSDFFIPVAMLVLGVAVLTATIISASLGVFDKRDIRESLPGVAPAFSSTSLRLTETSDAGVLLREWHINEMVENMTDEQKVGQLLLLRSHNIPTEDFCQEITDTCAGGIVLFAGDVKDKSADQLTAYIDRLQEASDGNMLVCVDEEGGSVVRVSSNRKLRSGAFRSPQKLYAEGGMEYISFDAAEKAGFLRQFGFNVNFAPVADVVTDPKAMMYDRAFGQDAEATGEYVATVVTASEAAGMGTCIKHFPGYGNTSGDTHNGIVTLDTALEQLRQNDFIPFAAGIDAGCNSVMITHTIMSAIDPLRPASMSPDVISLLREELGFEGVIISDGMDMGAIKAYSGNKDVCVAAFVAGIDLICTPADGREAFVALLEAVGNGTIPMEKLDAAVTRILRWKIALGLNPSFTAPDPVVSETDVSASDLPEENVSSSDAA